MSVNESTDNVQANGNQVNGAAREVYMEPKVSGAIAQQLMDKLRGNKDFGELDAVVKGLNVEDFIESAIKKLETNMTNMSDEDMSTVMALGMKIMLQCKDKNPNVNAITKDIFNVLKMLKIDLTTSLIDLVYNIIEPQAEQGSMLALMQGYMKSAREGKVAHFTYKEQLFGFLRNTMGDTHRLFRQQLKHSF